ncbi:MAG: hypothetical protein AAGE52_39570, partial [Myxococcota bacterium]
MKRAVRSVGWLVVILVGTVASALHHVGTPKGRAALCAELQSQLSATVEGTLTLRCERVEADHVELRNVRLTSPEGTTLAR